MVYPKIEIVEGGFGFTDNSSTDSNGLTGRLLILINVTCKRLLEGTPAGEILTFKSESGF